MEAELKQFKILQPLDIAREAFNKKDYLRAIFYYRHICEKDPKNGEIKCDIAQCYFDMNFFGYSLFYANDSFFLTRSIRAFYLIIISIWKMNGNGRVRYINMLLAKYKDKIPDYIPSIKKKLDQVCREIVKYSNSIEYKNECKKIAQKFFSSDTPDYDKMDLFISFRHQFPPLPFPNYSLLYDNLNSLAKNTLVHIQDSNRGKILIADKPFKKGEIIIFEKALISVTLRDDCCFHCTRIFEKKKKIWICSKCDMKCCSDECFNTAIRYHPCDEGWINLVKDCYKMENVSLRNLLMIIKLVCITMVEIEHEEEDDYFEFVRNYIYSLGMGSIEQFSKVEFFSTLITEIRLWESFIRALPQPIENYPFLDYTYYKDMEQRFITNTDNFGNSEDLNYKKIGNAMAVYLLKSKINHSCLSNAMCDWNQEEYGSDIRVSATRDIKIGEEITLCYLAEPFNEDKRQENKYFLMDYYNFECTCPLCIKKKKP